jgi:SAM-dependent methyltransferase
MPPALPAMSILRCEQCGTSFADPPFVPAGYYEAVYRHAGDLTGYVRYQRFRRQVAASRHPLEYLAGQQDAFWGIQALLARQTDKTRIRVVEVGSGLGYLTAALRRDGYDATGIDVSEVAVREAVDRFGPYYVQEDLFDPNSQIIGGFDLAILTEVVEHVSDPVGFVAATARLLAEHGRLIVTTPNRDIYPPDETWASDLPPMHLYWFSERGMRVLAQRLGYTCDFVDFTERNRRYREMVRSGASRSLPRPMLDGTLRPFQPLSRKERLVEFVEQWPRLASRIRAGYHAVDPSSRLLKARSHSMVALLAPVSGEGA